MANAKTNIFLWLVVIIGLAITGLLIEQTFLIKREGGELRMVISKLEDTIEAVNLEIDENNKRIEENNKF